MRTHPEREAIEHLIPRLRPFVPRNERGFALPDGTELSVMGVSYASRPAGCRIRPVLVLTRAKGPQGHLPIEPLDYAGLVILREETESERHERGLSPNFAATRIFDGAAPETIDGFGRCVVYPIADASVAFPLLISDRS